ncbi:DUF7507 domain-containing protein [Arsenicicoccus dermatophilus]|uniref:DUF7507 domain-containing protein n=1 Tax=Arsenicicoccus dermatophilus TaxID=1076331 RepID=UPI003B9803FB
MTYTDTKLGISGVACGTGPLAPGESRVCPTRTYALTQADIDAGKVDNTATATGTDPAGVKATGPDTVTTDVARTPGIALVKKLSKITDNGDGVVGAGDTMSYTFTVTNTGNVTLDPVTYTDAQLGVTAAACGTTPLKPGESRDCPPLNRVRTQADVDAGAFTNSATATGTAPDGTTTSASSSVIVATKATISLDKVASVIKDTNSSGRADVGDTIDYTFTVTNTGTVTLGQVTLTDARLGYAGAVCTSTTLAPGASTTCLAKTYPLTQADVNAGVVDNTATAYGTATINGARTPTVSDATSTTVPQSSTITLDKTASAIADTNSTGRADAGDTVTYSFVVRNTGTTTLSAVTLTDPTLGLAAVACGTGDLAPGATRTCTAYPLKLTQAQVDAGGVNNTATIAATDPKGTPVSGADDASTSVTAASGIKLAKTAGTIVDVNGNKEQDVNDTVTYTFTITNTGNTTLSPVTLTDPMVGMDRATCGGRTSLAPGASTSCTATYALTLADLNNNGMTNTATAAGLDPTGQTVTNTQSAPVSITAVRSISMDKQLVAAPSDTNGDGVIGAGDTLTYRFYVKNTGNLSLHDVRYTDARIGIVDQVCTSQVLDPGMSAECPTSTYTITQKDLDQAVTLANGTKTPAVVNSATTTGLTPKNIPVSGSDRVETPLAETPLLQFDKTASGIVDANNDGKQSVGDTITYTFTTTNTGNVTMTLVGVTDAKLGMSNVQCTPNTIAPRESSTCTRTYALTQVDVDAGTVDNVNAYVTASTPLGKQAKTTDSTSTPVTQAPSLSATKHAINLIDNGDGITSVGDKLVFAITVTNTGTATLGDVTYTDPLISATPMPCGSGPLAPGATRTCPNLTYTGTATDYQNGVIVNTVTLAGTTGTGTTVTGNASVTVPTRQGIDLVKSVTPIDDVDANGPDAGDKVTYSFTITNTGTTPLDRLVMDDALLGIVKAGGCTVPVLPDGSTYLMPGKSTTCTQRGYTLTQADVDAGKVVNTATAYGFNSTLPMVHSPLATSTVQTDITPDPTIVLGKTSGGATDSNNNGRIDVGEPITYSFTVTNTGNQTIRNVTITDAMLGLSGVPCVTGTTTTLAPGTSVACTARTYALKQTDVDAATVTNTATAAGTSPAGTAVTSTRPPKPTVSPVSLRSRWTRSSRRSRTPTPTG